MIAVGAIRKVDELGRLVIPKEVRNRLNIPCGTSMEFFVQGNRIVIGKHGDSCSECGGTEDLLRGLSVVKLCKECAHKLLD